MDEQANITLVKQCYDAFMKGDIPRLLGFMDPAIDWELPAMDAVPFSGKRQGQDQVVEFFGMLNDAQTANEFMPREFIAQGNRVVVLGHYSWTLRANNEHYESDWTHIFTIRNGKVASFREFMDSHIAAEAFETLPEGVLSGTGTHTDMGRPSLH
jgi:uncharacterized protein